MKKIILALLAIVFISACTMPDLPFIGGQNQELYYGPEFRLEVDPASVFAGDETTLYVDVENNDKKTYSKVVIDVFDTGILEETKDDNAITGNVLGDLPSFSFTFDAKISKYCHMYGVYDSGGDFSEYLITCNYNYGSGDTIIPVYVEIYKAQGQKTQYYVEAFPNLNWNDVQSRTGLTYDSVSKTLYITGTATSFRHGAFTRVGFPNGVSYNYATSIDMSNGKPKGSIKLSKNSGDFTNELKVIPTSKKDIVIVIEDKGGEYNNNYNYRPYKGVIENKHNYIPYKGVIEDKNFEGTASSGQTEIRISGLMSDADLAEIGLPSPVSTAVNPDTTLPGFEANKQKLCEFSKKTTGLDDKLYYYCDFNGCSSGSNEIGEFTVDECGAQANSKINEKMNQGIKAAKTYSCDGTTECSGYCNICYEGVCVKSDSRQTIGDSCELSCQCSVGLKCNNGVCEAPTPIKDSCIGGTKANSCVDNQKPNYCDSAGNVFSNCDECGCPSGKECLSDGSCGKEFGCHATFEEFLPFQKNSLACKLKAPMSDEILENNVKVPINVRLRYRDKIQISQVIDFMTQDAFERETLVGRDFKKPSVYSYSNRDISVGVEFSEDMPIVQRGHDVFVHFDLRNAGTGMIFPVKLYEDFEIIDSENIIDIDSCDLTKIIKPEGKKFPRITCKLNVPEDVNYLKSSIISINIEYAYEFRKAISVNVVK